MTEMFLEDRLVQEEQKHIKKFSGVNNTNQAKMERLMKFVVELEDRILKLEQAHVKRRVKK